MLANDGQSKVPEAIWTVEAGQSVIQPAVTVGRSLLLATQDSRLKSDKSRVQAFDLGDGSKRWQHEFEFARVSGIQILQLANSKLELAIVTTSSLDSKGGRGSIVAIEESGKIRWQSALIEDHFSAPYIQDGFIYVTSGTNRLHMITPEVSKDQVRRISLDVIASPSAPTAEKGTAFIPCQAPELLAVDLDGGTRWHFQFQSNTKDWLDKTPAVSDGRVFCSSSAGRVEELIKICRSKRPNVAW
jgi:outer membrane protein assembly factor BamB